MQIPDSNGKLVKLNLKKILSLQFTFPLSFQDILLSRFILLGSTLAYIKLYNLISTI